MSVIAVSADRDPPSAAAGRCGRAGSRCRSLSCWSSWPRGPGIPAFEQAASAAALIACTASAARLLRAGARQTDVDADGLSKKMAAGAVAGEEAERRAARTADVHVTVDVARLGDAVLSKTARRLLRAALTGLAPTMTLPSRSTPPAEESPARLTLRVRGHRSDHASLRRCAEDSGALVSDLGDHELLIRLQPVPEPAAEPVTWRTARRTGGPSLPSSGV